MYFIQTSTIDGAGRGVFAKQEIRPNKIILKYNGIELNPIEYEKAYPNDDSKYVLEIKRGLKTVFIDAKDELDQNYAHLINDVKNSNKPPNVQFTTKGYIKTIKKIKPGDELLINYGKNYFWE